MDTPSLEEQLDRGCLIDPVGVYDRRFPNNNWRVLEWLLTLRTASQRKYPPEATLAMEILGVGSELGSPTKEHLAEADAVEGMAEVLTEMVRLHPLLQTQVLALPTIQQALLACVTGICRWADKRGLLRTDGQ